jgi:hypothetical protein
MKVLIEIKNGMIQKCYSTNKDAEIQILDYDNQESEVPDLIEIESELMSAKEMKDYVENEMNFEMADLENNE